MKVVAPYVNINGNSKKDLLDQVSKCHSSMNDVIENFSKCDFAHGRNSRDNAHREELYQMRYELSNKLMEVQDVFLKLYNEINNQ